MSSFSVTRIPGEVQTDAGTVPKVKPIRLTALDAWRGLTVLLMLLVNNVALGGRTPYPQ